MSCSSISPLIDAICYFPGFGFVWGFGLQGIVLAPLMVCGERAPLEAQFELWLAFYITFGICGCQAPA